MATKKTSHKNVSKSGGKASGKILDDAANKTSKVEGAGKPKQPAIDFGMLNRWNSILAGAYLLEAVAILIAATNNAFPVVLNFLGLDTLATSAKGHDVFASATHPLFDASLTWVIVLFLLASAVTYFLMATYLRTYYEKNFAERLNPIRWVGHGVSAGFMLVGVGLVTGVQDFTTLLTLFALGLGMGGLYALAERQHQKPSTVGVYNYWIGTAAGLLAWVILGFYAWGAHMYGAGVPPYLHWVYPAVFVLFGVIAGGLYLQFRAQGKWTDASYGERIFLALSFVVQTVLAWALFAGSLRP